MSSQSQSSLRLSPKHSDSSYYDSISQSLYHQLRPMVINSDHNEGSQSLYLPPFLPLDVINDKITKDRVNSTTSSLTPIYKSFRSSQVAKRARKVFAILGLYEEEAAIWDLFDDGLIDEDLPLARQKADWKSDSCRVLVSCRGREFNAFSRVMKSRAITDFLQEQWLVLAPVFAMQGEHICVDRQSPLPFYDIKRISPNYISTVYKGLLHAAHLIPEAKDPVQIAIKDYVEEKDFIREKQNLVAIQDLKHPHLVRHIATVQQGSRFYVIFPWADGGNLSDFWKRDPDALQTRDPALFMWSLQQMHGIVKALSALHGVNCRHGDLKPENILHFQTSSDPAVENKQYGALVIADVGVSRVHSQATEFRSNPTNTNATTLCYEAPEAEYDKHSPRRRRYDMWSVGCVFTEFVIWLLYGERAISEFRSLRRREDDQFPQKGAYYRSTRGTTEVHPVVRRAFDTLVTDPRCGKGTGLAELVSLITNDLIVIDPGERAEAGELEEKFENIVQKAKENPDYLIRKVEPPCRTPDIFIPGG
ncbi:kinase-like protein [Hypoxylon argillaceum]|nr:kinase-like protein [Hypoxylon argillaceum]